MKTRAVAALKAHYPLSTLLDVAGIARSTFFYHQARLDAADPQAELKVAISKEFKAAKARYGHRKIHSELVKKGWRVAKKTVLKLMRKLGLTCKVRQRRKYNSFKGQVGVIAPNVLNRDFTADQPNQKWVTDVTEFHVAGRKAYLSPIIDLFDNAVIAHTIGLSPNLGLTNDSLRLAVATLDDGEHPIVHSDQGFQYQHASWRRILNDVEAVQSMSRKATCLDNSVAENFFSHLKEEMFHHDSYATIDELIAAVNDYIDWYNNIRNSTKLKGLSPVQYRSQALAA